MESIFFSHSTGKKVLIPKVFSLEARFLPTFQCSHRFSMHTCRTQTRIEIVQKNSVKEIITRH